MSRSGAAFVSEDSCQHAAGPSLCQPGDRSLPMSMPLPQPTLQLPNCTSVPRLRTSRTPHMLEQSRQSRKRRLASRTLEWFAFEIQRSVQQRNPHVLLNEFPPLKHHRGGLIQNRCLGPGGAESLQVKEHVGITREAVWARVTLHYLW